MEYKNYRVKSPLKSFRDLEVYQKTIELSEEITNLDFLNKKKFEEDIKEIKETTQKIPKLIAESYGDKFDSKELAHKKLTEAVTLITDVITKIDLFKQGFLEDKESTEILSKILTRYSYQKRKVLNLRKAWQRIAEYDKTKNPNKKR